MIAVLAIPFFSMRAGLLDASTDPLVVDHLPGLPAAGEGVRSRVQRAA